MNDFPKTPYSWIALCEMNRLFILKYSVWLQLPRDELATFGRYQDLVRFYHRFSCQFKWMGRWLYFSIVTPFPNTFYKYRQSTAARFSIFWREKIDKIWLKLSKKSVCRLSFVHCPQDELGKKYQLLIDFRTQSSQVGLYQNKCNDVKIFFSMSVIGRFKMFYSMLSFWRMKHSHHMLGCNFEEFWTAK